MYESFASHCRQDYPGEYEILFAVGSPDDPAIEAIERLQREFPERGIQSCPVPRDARTNGKVSSLVQALPHARFDYILISDSDILVSPWYLRRIMAGFGEAEAARRSAWSPRSTAARRIARFLRVWRRWVSRPTSRPMSSPHACWKAATHFGLGSTLAVSREALDAVGGLLPLADYVADDYHLGARIAAKGFEIVLSREVVETSVPEYTFPEFLAHQLRWRARCGTLVRPATLARSLPLAWHGRC